MPVLLDLYCGAGGAAMGYHQAGWDVVGVDIKPQPRYPFAFIQADALSVPLGDAAAIHASPPCQAYSRMHGSAGVDLVAETRARLVASGRPFVIENVEGAPLHAPIRLCGSMFDLDVQRHRLFEANWPLSEHQWPCRHGIWSPRYRVHDHGRRYLAATPPVFGSGGGKSAEHWAAAMQIDWMTRAELSQAVPPAYTAFIGRQLLAQL